MVIVPSDCFSTLFYFGVAIATRCYCIDVSKATRQVAVAIDRKVTQIFKITHDVFGLNQLNTVILQFETFPDIVFEATGI